MSSTAEESGEITARITSTFRAGPDTSPHRVMRPRAVRVMQYHCRSGNGSSTPSNHAPTTGAHSSGSVIHDRPSPKPSNPNLLQMYSADSGSTPENRSKYPSGTARPTPIGTSSGSPRISSRTVSSTHSRSLLNSRIPQP